MTSRNVDGILTACDNIARHSVQIAGGYHGSTWLFNQVMRAFDFPPTEAVTYEVFLNVPVWSKAYATIHRNGHYEIYR